MRIHPLARALRFLLVLTVALAFAGCGDVDQDNPEDNGPVVSEQGLYEAHVTPTPSPPQTGENMLMMHVMSPDGDGLEGLDLTVEPWMPAHGHGSPEVPVVEEKGDGMYSVTNLVYSMPGRWEVRVDIEGDAGSDTIILKYSVQ